MARKFLTNIDLNINELQNAVIQNLATDPEGGSAGQIYFNTVDQVLKVYNGDTEDWQAVGSEEFIGDSVAALLAAGDGIFIDYDDENDTLTISNTGVLSLSGTTNEVEVSASAGAVTIGLPDTIYADVVGDLTGNADTATALETARTISLGGDLSGSASFDGTQNVTIEAFIDSQSSVSSITGTTNEVEVSASVGAVTIGLPDTIYVDVVGDVTGDLTGNADTATALETARAISLSGDLSGSASFDGTQGITIEAFIQPDSVALGTDTTGDYVAGATSGDGISISGSGGEGSTLSISNTGVLSVVGTNNEVTVSASAGNVTIGLPDDVTVAGDLTVDGNLVVSGSTTYLNVETIEVEDNIILLNRNVTGTPSADSGIEVNRGDEPNASFYWDESEDKWTASDGTAATAVSLEGHSHVASDITDFEGAVEDVIDDYLIGSDSISISSGSVDVTLAASASYLTKTGGLAVDKGALETALVADSFTRKYSETIENATDISYEIDHGLNTRDVTVQVYELSTYETVEVDVERTTTSKVNVTFAGTSGTDSYRVVVVG
jgi:hypothetical protein